MQRVNNARLTVDNKLISQISSGYLVLVGYTDEDTEEICERIVDRIIGMRVFKDDCDKLNLTLGDVGGEVMVVSNFTLYGNAFSGRRPDFSKSAKYDKAKPLYDFTVEEFRRRLGKVATGVFGEHMHIDSSIDGPITMVLEK
ncbi:MAG: D-tyrosyl-tRNA(Tyr) deacylase [Clostridia bacterium]|nr:D-tyrosyl-tRNA(Tyr) deacylase [Clostridia bacterium]